MALDPPIDLDPPAVRALLEPLRNDFSIAVVSSGNDFATGAIIRVAHNYLAKEIYLIGERRFYEKASMGMEKYESIVHVPDVASFREAIGTRPLWAIEKEHASTSIHSVERFPSEVVLAFGSERFGLPKALLAAAAKTLAIPIYGINNSLPVAVAAGIVMAEWARRRYACGATVPRLPA